MSRNCTPMPIPMRGVDNRGIALKKFRGSPNFDENRGVLVKRMRHRKVGSCNTQVLHARAPLAT